MAERTKAKIGAPKGTRDLYPLDAARRRFLTETWRRVALDHGFDEIDGPMFEALDLYTVKSGPGIVSELFQAFSGKDERELDALRAGGKAPFALRPEFTPTLARMYAARANALPRPAKWFSVGPFFRAERPQRGRLREFLQWNVDQIGDDSPQADAEVVACCVGALDALGLGPEVVRVKVSNRNVVARALLDSGIGEDALDQAFALLDKRHKLPSDALAAEANELGLDLDRFDARTADAATDTAFTPAFRELGLADWVDNDYSIVRGLAYYTGTVFEIIAEGERAVAGGGRYDGLIELFDGPATPAVGFAMGDVVLANLLQDRGLMPSDDELMDRIGARPDAFVIPATDALDGAALGVAARLRREGLHARRTYKTTRNLGKLLKEASSQHSRFAVIVESATEATVKHLDGADQERLPLEGIADWIASRR